MPMAVMHSFVTSLKLVGSNPLLIFFCILLFVNLTNCCNILLLYHRRYLLYAGCLHIYF
jgi:hypothetical protein